MPLNNSWRLIDLCQQWNFKCKSDSVKSDYSCFDISDLTCHITE